ncbi:MAG: pseudaminic acid synthase [Desulfobacula sp.]|jgi:pseudaminic acid synthase|nr:pseudaminic acid synthase [Desulfobacula sp.]
MRINQKKISPEAPPYIIAEMSANHNQCYETAVKILEAAKDAGADAVKLQTYTPKTLTIKSHAPCFMIKDTIWKGRQLFDLYQQAHMPWEWHPKLKQIADHLGLDLFSTPFDASAINFLEPLRMPAYKIASFELTDLELLKKAGKTKKPIILSTGMASIAEIDEAVRTLRASGCKELALLKCTSSYPADPKDANLKTIPHLSKLFAVPAGLSDHTMGSALPVAAVALGASIIEKHFCISRKEPGPDTSFSMEPHEFKQMVKDIRTAHLALGRICFELSDKEKQSIVFRRSLFAVKDIRAKEAFSPGNIRSIRPGYGLHPRYMDQIIGKKAKKNIPQGTPLSWDLLL